MRVRDKKETDGLAYHDLGCTIIKDEDKVIIKLDNGKEYYFYRSEWEKQQKFKNGRQ